MKILSCFDNFFSGTRCYGNERYNVFRRDNGHALNIKIVVVDLKGRE